MDKKWTRARKSPILGLSGKSLTEGDSEEELSILASARVPIINTLLYLQRTRKPVEIGYITAINDIIVEFERLAALGNEKMEKEIMKDGGRNN